MALSPNDFGDPPWGAPLQTDRVIADISDDETIAGMFYLALMEGSKRRGVPLQFPRERYMQFSFYPLKEFARVLVQAARLFFPDRPVRQGLRILGALGPRAFATSTLGKVTLGAAADVHAALGAIAKTYEINIPKSRCNVVDSGAKSMILSLQNVVHFLDSHHVGVFEGTLEHIGVTGRVRIASSSVNVARLLVEWA